MDGPERLLFTVQVEGTVGGQADEHPRAFLLKERRIAVEELLDRWDGEDHAYFKLRGDDGFLYILRYDRQVPGWEVTLVERPT